MSARCAPAPIARRDGSYRITGSKIFITYGDHDMTDNIVHFVLARLPDAPAGHQGHFAVPDPEIPGQCRRLARRAQRHLSERRRAQARHACLAHLHHDHGRSWRRHRLPDRRGKSGHALHVHDDEPGAPRRRPRRRRRCRPRLSAGAGLRAGTQAGPRGRQHRRRLRSDHRASRRQAHADADARA